MIRIAICDDDEKYQLEIKEKLETWLEENHVQAIIDLFNNGDSLLEKSQRKNYHILFLDVVLPLFNGIEIAKEIRKSNNEIKIIFLSSSPEFAIDSYLVNADDYCLKPISNQKVKEILNEYFLTQQKVKNNIIIKDKNNYYKINFYEIEYVEVLNKNVIFNLTSNKKIKTNKPFYEIEKILLNHDGFYKCHRSYIVYMPNIDHFNSKEIITVSNYNIPIARAFYQAFKNEYLKYMFENK